MRHGHGLCALYELVLFLSCVAKKARDNNLLTRSYATQKHDVNTSTANTCSGTPQHLTATIKSTKMHSSSKSKG